MKRFALVIALACVLSGSALAGDIHTADAPAPGDQHGADAPAPGDQGNGGLAAQALLTILDLAF
jgi:hypothetical protein